MSDTGSSGGSGGGPQEDEDRLEVLTGQPRVIRSFQERRRRIAELPTVARSERVPDRQFHGKGTIAVLPIEGGGSGGGEARPRRGVVRRYRIADLPLRNVMQLTEAQQRNWARRRIEMYPHRDTGYHQGSFKLEAGYKTSLERQLMKATGRYSSLGRIIREERQIIKEKPFKHLLDSVFVNSRDYRNKRIREGRRGAVVSPGSDDALEIQQLREQDQRRVEEFARQQQEREDQKKKAVCCSIQ